MLKRISLMILTNVAVLVLVVFPFGAVIKFVKEDVKLTFYMLHESFGFLILWLMLARILVRWLAPPPPSPPMPAIFERSWPSWSRHWRTQSRTASTQACGCCSR